jgi:hypothetical protein
LDKKNFVRKYWAVILIIVIVLVLVLIRESIEKWLAPEVYAIYFVGTIFDPEAHLKTKKEKESAWII